MPKEIYGVRTESRREAANVVDRDVPLGTLHGTYVGPVDPGEVSERLLRNPERPPKSP